jgi:hypothetical protein
VLWNGRVLLTHDGRWPTLILAACFGVDAALILRSMRRRAHLAHQSGAGALGVAVGLLGAGCASCGSVFLSSLLGVGATVGALSWLPLHGREFTWLGIGLLVVSIFSLSKKIVEPVACAIPARR